LNVKTSQFDYNLPSKYIAQTPVEPRHASRLLILNRSSGEITHSHFYKLGKFLQRGDLLVINKTRVLPARIYARKPTGGKVELLLLRSLEPLIWRVLVGGKRVKKGLILHIPNGPDAEIIEELSGSERLVNFKEPIVPFLDYIGEMPLPPYIHKTLEDPERYQTVYSKESGSAAAPTAGLHFSEELIEKLKSKGIRFAQVTLHVGLDTFAPVIEEKAEDHKIHKEWCRATQETADLINQTHLSGGRIVAVGTTTVRVLETAAKYAYQDCIVGEFTGMTDLFILPGFQFRVVDALVTNFHLPHSTLLMMVSAFAGMEKIMHAYQIAIQENYRFYSFGDAMFIM
jgi:S-adenosylmethionine:tRNA ribosyltransferase-isomerase